MGGQAGRCNPATAVRGGIRFGNGSHGEPITGSLSLNGKQLKVPTKPYEIKTVEVKFSHMGRTAAAMSHECAHSRGGHWRHQSCGRDCGCEGKILAQGRKPMVANGTAEAGLHAVIGAIDSMHVHGARDRSIGICAPGPLDPKTGVVLNPPNVPCWRNFPLAEKISAKYKVPVKVDNDANAAALAETRWGAARGLHYVFYATIGTGLEQASCSTARIYHGNTGSAGEGGHVSIDYRGPVCNCGKRGCIEVLASGPAIGSAGAGQGRGGTLRASAMLELARETLRRHQRNVAQSVRRRRSHWRARFCRRPLNFSPWLGNIVDLLDPDVIVMGGGVAAMLQTVFRRNQEALPEWCVNPRASEIPLLMAHYGADAGIAGGAALCA